MGRRSTGKNTVLDDRDAEVTLYRGALNLFASSHLPRKKLKRFRKAAKLPAIERDFVLFGDLEKLVLFPLLLLGYFAMRYLYSERTVWFVPIVVLVWSMFKSVAFGLHRQQRQMRATTLTKTMLGEGHCPSCAYNLRGLDVQDDGCTVCPECGGAWRVPKVSK